MSDAKMMPEGSENDANPYELSQMVLSAFGSLDEEGCKKFIETSPMGELDSLEYIAAACILSKEVPDLAAAFGITEAAARQITGWAMASMLVLPMSAEPEEEE